MTLQEKLDRIEVLDEIIDKKSWEMAKQNIPYQDFQEAVKVYRQESIKLSKETRLELNPEMSPQDDIGDLMEISDFISCVEMGGFIDYDGFGYYSNKTEQSNIIILPSDIRADIYRKDFSHVKWYNR